MVPKEFRRSLCITAGWVTLLEAIIWGGASIYILGVFDCTWTFINLENVVSPWSMLYVTYFMGQCQGGPQAESLGFQMTPPADPARNLHVWIWIYTIVSAIWIPTCILLIIAASCEVRGKHGAILYYPWVGISSTFIILDLAGAIYHFMDVYNTTTPDNYAKLTYNTNWNNLTTTPSDGITTWLPSLYVSLFFCRFLLIWILNIFFTQGAFKASNDVSIYETKFIQSTIMPSEKKKTWKDTFYRGPDPSVSERLDTSVTNNSAGPQLRSPVTERQRETNTEGDPVRQEYSAARYKMDEFGIPIEELNVSKLRENSNNQNENPRSPYYPTGIAFDFTGYSARAESSKRQDSAPPMASGVQVPPELNKFEPFSYIAGDQPQLMRKPVSRSNSRTEYPLIPRPDYTIADRRSGSLEYVPNRFKVPSPKRPVRSPSSLSQESYPHSPKSPRIPPTPPKKPQIYPRSTPTIPENPGVTSETKFIPQQSLPSQQQDFYTRQTSQNSSYNINKLY